MAFASVTETHSAVLFFVGDRVYKMKKPVRFGFLDFTSREARSSACHREVELNRRLAPDVYLGVVDVLAPDGSPCEHMVVMHALPSDRRLSTLVCSGADVSDGLRDVARQIAAFHAEAVTGPEIDRAAGANALRLRWTANLAELDGLARGDLDRESIARCLSWAQTYLAGRGPLFATRIHDGRARDGHGDLLADDIFCLDDGPRIIDCLDFDDHLRWDDVAGDVAFLAMDLERLGRSDLAEIFLQAYEEFSGDCWPASLMHHHIAYRALVRSKVGCIRRDQGDPSKFDSAKLLLQLAHEHLRTGRVRLILVGGLPGTGKSTLAAGVGEALNATVLRSDEIRKELVGVAASARATAPVGAGIYTTDMSDRTYRELLDRAEIALGLGETVVLDASWHNKHWREAAGALATSTSAELLQLCCKTDAAVAASRIEARSRAGTDPSDATPAVLQAMRADWPEWLTATDVDTTGQPGDVLHAVMATVN